MLDSHVDNIAVNIIMDQVHAVLEMWKHKQQIITTIILYFLEKCKIIVSDGFEY